MVWALSLIGELTLSENGSPVPYPATGLAIAGYLATSPSFSATRRQISAFLWDGTTRTNHSGNLRQLISRIRIRQEQIVKELLLFEQDRVLLNVREVRVDLLTVECARSTTALGDATSVLLAASRGEFMEGFEPEGDRGRTWLAASRSALRRTLSDLISSAIEGRIAVSDSSVLKEAAIRVIEADPHQELAYQALMRILARERQLWQVREVFDRCRTRLSEDLGVEPDPSTVALVRQIFMGGSEWATPPSVPRSETAALAPRIALLPPRPNDLDCTSSDMAAALIEDVTIGLCCQRSISIVAPRSSEEIAALDCPVDDLAIDYVVEGRVSTAGSAPSVFISLVDARARTVLWSDRHRIDGPRIEAAYVHLVKGVVGSVVAEVERAATERGVPRHAPGAYRSYLAATRLLRAMDLPSIRRARKHFRAAVTECPDYAAALAGLARTHHLEWLLLARGDSGELARARELATRAVGADARCVHALRELGLAEQLAGRFVESLNAFELAESVGPQYADLLADHADALAHASKPQASLDKITRAIELNPLCPDDYWWIAGGACFLLGRYGDAVRALKRMKQLSPGYRLLAACCAMAGETEESASYVRKARTENPLFRVDKWLSVLPIRDPTHRSHYEEGLRLAGFR